MCMCVCNQKASMRTEREDASTHNNNNNNNNNNNKAARQSEDISQPLSNPSPSMHLHLGSFQWQLRNWDRFSCWLQSCNCLKKDKQEKQVTE